MAATDPEAVFDFSALLLGEFMSGHNGFPLGWGEARQRRDDGGLSAHEQLLLRAASSGLTPEGYMAQQTALARGEDPSGHPVDELNGTGPDFIRLIAGRLAASGASTETD